METLITLHGRHFKPMIPYERIAAAVKEVASRITADYAGRETPLFIGVLNGSFMFMGELMKSIDFNCEVAFIRIASYSGTQSTGRVNQLLGLSQSVKGRHVIIVEDIIDTGVSIEYSTRLIREQEPASLAVATLLFKPECYKQTIPIDYCALEVPDRFIVGFGLDYDQLGRNYKDIYEITDNK